MIIRVRTQLGTWRLKDVQAEETIARLRDRLEREHNTDLQGRPLTKDPAGSEPLADHITVKSAQLRNGDMVYAMVDDQKVHELAKTKREITKDGNIVALKYSSAAARSGFRPGMLPLRDMKMQWTLNDFIALDEQVALA
jgi:nuclear protein localization protein 4 homolog